METLNNKITGSNLPATEWNQVPSELQNVITQTGQALTNADLNQLGKGIAEYVANGEFYTDSGASNAYVLTQIGSKQAPTAYVDGLIIRFIPGNGNTSASTVNVAALGIKSIVNFNGSALVGGEIVVSDPVRAFFDLGNDRFQLLLEIGTNNYSLLKSGRKNFIINGSMDIFQRGTAFSVVGYTADRWFNVTAATTVDRVNSPFAGVNFALRVQAGGANNPAINYHIELDEVGTKPPFISNTDYTLSFNISDSAAGADIRLTVDLVDNSAGANAVAIITGVNIGTTINGAQRIEFTFNFGAPILVASNQALRLAIFLSTNASVFILTSVQLEEGSNATAFETVSEYDEIPLCERYFQKSYLIGNPPGATTIAGRIHEIATRVSATVVKGLLTRTRMRVVPTFIAFSDATGASGVINNSGVDRAATPAQAASTGLDNWNMAGGTNAAAFYQWTADAEI